MRANKSIIRITILISCFNFIYFICFSQTDNCLASLKEAIGKLKSIEVPEKGKSYFMRLKIHAFARNNHDVTSPTTTSNIEITITENEYLYTSEHLSLYYEDDFIYTIVHPHKTIIQTQKNDQIDKVDLRKQMLINAQDSLLNNSKVIYCKILKDSIIEVKLQPNKLLSESLLIDNIIYSINTNSVKIQKVSVTYLSPHKLRRQTVQYLTLDFDKLDRGAISSYVLDKNRRLNPNFKGYQFVDRTKQ